MVKNFKWEDFLRQNSLFSSITEKEIEWLLTEEVSEEKYYPSGSVIRKEGDSDDSIFVVGSGLAQACLLGEDGPEVTLSILSQGEFFGEMALFEKKPRSATIVAKESCTVLKITGGEFLKLLDKHPEIAFKVLLKLSERLRYTSEQIRAIKLKDKDVDEKINLFNIKLDTERQAFNAEQKSIDALLRAAQAFFDHIKLRTHEIIDNADRSRSRLTNTVTALGGIISIVAVIFGVLGIQKLESISNVERDIKTRQIEVSSLAEQVKTSAAFLKDSEVAVKNLTNGEELNRLYNDIINVRKGIAEYILKNLVREALEHKETPKAIKFYEPILGLDDPILTKTLLVEIETLIVDTEDRSTIKALLEISVRDIDTPNEKIRAYYLLLAVLILDNKYKEKEFRDTFSAFKKYVGEHKSQRFEEEDFSLFNELFKKQGQEKYNSFRDVKRLISYN